MVWDFFIILFIFFSTIYLLLSDPWRFILDSSLQIILNHLSYEHKTCFSAHSNIALIFFFDNWDFLQETQPKSIFHIIYYYSSCRYCFSTFNFHILRQFYATKYWFFIKKFSWKFKSLFKKYLACLIRSTPTNFCFFLVLV